jgi:RNA polymerase sigma factor (sigma-70 family)
MTNAMNERVAFPYWHALSCWARLGSMDFAPNPSPTVSTTASTGIEEPISDETLMQQFQAGDAGAFDVLYARHRAGLFRFVARQMDGRSETEELFQEVWMNVIESRADYVVNAKFRTWLFTLAHHRVMDFFRKHRRVAWLAFDADKTSDDDAPNLSETLSAARTEEPDVQAESRQQAAAILKLIEALPPPQREAFLLSEEAGLSVPEIARVTGVSLEAAKSRLRYAVAKLREGLKDFR